MSADLTLPGTLPGLLRRGAPTRERDGRTGVVLRMETVSSFGVFAGEPAARVTLDSEPDQPPGQILCGFLHLDLTDPTGMDIAARWLAERVGLAVGATAPRWRYTDSGWELSVGSAQAWECVYFATAARFHHIVLASVTVTNVPQVEEVTDPRAALRLACLHVGGGE